MNNTTEEETHYTHVNPEEMVLVNILFIIIIITVIIAVIYFC